MLRFVPNEPVLTSEERQAINGGRWFASLSPTLRHDILRHARVVRHADGERLVTCGEMPNTWVACARGALQMCATTTSGRPVIRDHVEPGQWLGVLDLFEQGPADHDLCARGHTTTLQVPRQALQDILFQHRELYVALLRLNDENTQRLMSRVDDLKTLGLRQRLAKQLLEWAQKYGMADTSGIRITLRLAQHELGQLLGASRQRVNEQIKLLERQSAIRVDAGALVVCNAEVLRRVSLEEAVLAA